MTEPKPLNPNDLQFVGKPTGQVVQEKEKSFDKPTGKMTGVAPAREAGALTEDSIINLDGVPEEQPSYEPPIKGTYECSIDEFKLGISQANNLKIGVKLKILNPGFEKKVIFWNIMPEFDFGLIAYNQLLKRAVTVNKLGSQCALAEVAKNLPLKTIADSGMAINARIQLTGAPKAQKDDPSRVNFNITQVSTPKTASFI